MTGHAVAAAVEAGSRATPIRVVLADDHAIVRRGIRAVIDSQDGFELISEAHNPESTGTELSRHHPDVLVLYLQASDGALALVRSLRERQPDTRIVVITIEDDPAFAAQVLSAGASGCVLRVHVHAELPTAVRLARDGQTFISPALAAGLHTTRGAVNQDGITPRELEILRLTALGHTAPEIAEQLHLAVRTVETHRANIHRKLRMRTRAQLVRYAIGRGLLDD